MRSALPWLGAALASALLGSLALAQNPAPADLPYPRPAPATGANPAPAPSGAAYPAAGSPYYPGAAYPYAAPTPYRNPYGPRVAPDMCGPGWWGVNQCGAPYGPNYCVYPPFPPYNGERPSLGGNSPAFMTHPFARGPRDYFMLD